MGQQIGSFFKSKHTGQQIENMLDAFGNTAAAYETSTAYSVGDLVLYNNALYVCTGATTGAFDPSKWQQTTLAELVENLGATYTDPNSDGNVVIGVDSTVGEKILRSISFPSLTNRYYLPFAQYIRERLQNDPSAASFGIEIPDAEEAPMHSTVIKGKTVAVNQFSNANNGGGNNISSVTDYGNGRTGTATFTAGSFYSPVHFNSNHVYYAAATVSATTSATFYIQMRPQNQSAIGESTRINISANGKATCELIATNENLPGTGYIYTFFTNATANTTQLYLTNVMLIDLTLIFTSAELTAIGTDVAKLKAAWLKKFGYPLPTYIPYDAGSLANVDGVYRLRGKNLFDKSAVTAGVGLSDDGTTYSTANYFVSDFTRIEPNAVYYFNNVRKSTSGNAMCWYDANKNFIKYDRMSSTSDYASGEKTAPENAVYVRISSATAILDWCGFNVSDSAYNGTVEPYYNGGTIDCSTAPLNGVGTAQDEIDYATGKKTTRANKIKLYASGVSWVKSGNNGLFLWYNPQSSPFYLKLPTDSSENANLVCGRYTLTNYSSQSASPADKVCYTTWTSAGSKYFAIYDTAYANATAAEFKQALEDNDVELCYELATPVTSTETPQPVYTEYGYNVLEPVSGGVQSAEVDTTYYENIAGYIDKRLNGG